MAGWSRARGGLVPYVDAFVAWGSVLATAMVARKLLENWLYWMVLDSVAAALYWSQGFHATAVLFVAVRLDRDAWLRGVASGLRTRGARCDGARSCLIRDLPAAIPGGDEVELRGLLRRCAASLPYADGALTPIVGGRATGRGDSTTATVPRGSCVEAIRTPPGWESTG